MSARAAGITRLLDLQAALSAAWWRAYRRDDFERYEALQDRSRAVTAELVRTIDA